MAIFSLDSLHADVLAELARQDIPADHRVAIFATVDTTGQARAVVALRGGTHWSVEAGSGWTRGTGANGAVAFKGSW